MAHCILFSAQKFHRSQIGRNSVSLEALRVGGAAPLSLAWLNCKPMQANNARQIIKYCYHRAMLRRDDLQPLLPGASAANIHPRSAEGSQPGDEAMESVTNPSFGLGCHPVILRV